MSPFYWSFLFGVLSVGTFAATENGFKEVVTNFVVNLSKGRDVVLFGCNQNDLLETTKSLLQNNRFVYPKRISRIKSELELREILTRHSHARTSVIVDCKCNGSIELLESYSQMKYFNKTYQWMIWDEENVGVENILTSKLKCPGLNSQLTYVNRTEASDGYGYIHTLWDIHSKGRHLDSPLEFFIIAIYSFHDGFKILEDVSHVQGIKFRSRFNGLKLRGVSVIDQDNIISNEQIEQILSRPSKDAGVATFAKYHYDLINLLRHRLNFSVNYRNARGWAGRLENTTYRLGLLGILQRNEADIGASGAFNRLNRFAEFDIIHQSWKLETGFVYRFIPELDTDGKSGNFLAPFHGLVWLYATVSIFAVNFIWRLIERINETRHSMLNGDDQAGDSSPSFYAKKNVKMNMFKLSPLDVSETSWSALSLKTFAAVCQQGMDPVPVALSSRTVVITVFLFSLVMYNYYTSSVVGGLLSGTVQGPSTLEQIVASPLKLSFEDIGYYKILFRERYNRSRTVQRLYDWKVLPERSPTDMPVYIRLEDAINYLKKGGYAFHCEFIDAYPEIARQFDAGEICDLRLAESVLENEILNFDVTKQSQYSEIFRTVMIRSTEVGLISHLKRKHRPDKPRCQAVYRVFPIGITGMSTALMILAAGFFCGALVMCIERKVGRKL